MASYLHSFFLRLCLVMTITQLTFASRQLPTPAKDPNKKQPEWFIEPDGSVLIPGIGRYMIPSYKSYSTIPTFGGSGSGTPPFGSGSGSGSGTPPFGSGSGTPPFGSGSGGDSGSGSGGDSSSGGAGGTPGSGSGTPPFGNGSGGDSGSGLGGDSSSGGTGGTPESGSGTTPFGSGSDGDSGSGSGGDSNSGGTGGTPGSYIPGGDDTFVPNPGVEVPNPFGGGVPAPNVP